MWATQGSSTAPQKRFSSTKSPQEKQDTGRKPKPHFPPSLSSGHGRHQRQLLPLCSLLNKQRDWGLPCGGREDAVAQGVLSPWVGGVRQDVAAAQRSGAGRCGACSGLIALNQPSCTKVLPPWLEISCPLSPAPISRRGCQSPLSYQTRGLSQLPDSAEISSCAHEVWVVVNLILIKADYKYPLEMSLCIYRDSRTKTPSQQMFPCKMCIQGKQKQGTAWGLENMKDQTEDLVQRSQEPKRNSDKIYI